MKKSPATLGNFRDVYPKTLPERRRPINRSIRPKRFGIYTLYVLQPLPAENVKAAIWDSYRNPFWRKSGRQSGPTRNSRTKTAKQTHGRASFISWNKQLWYCPERRHFARLDVLSSAVALDNGRSENRPEEIGPPQQEWDRYLHSAAKCIWRTFPTEMTFPLPPNVGIEKWCAATFIATLKGTSADLKKMKNEQAKHTANNSRHR